MGSRTDGCRFRTWAWSELATAPVASGSGPDRLSHQVDPATGLNERIGVVEHPTAPTLV